MSSVDEKNILLLGDMIIVKHLGAKSYNVVKLLNQSDLVLGNFETTLATNGYPAPKMSRLRADHSVFEDIKKMNVKAVSLANNHTTDFGFEGLFKTMDLLSKNNIAYAGAGHNLMEALKPAILRLRDLKIAFIACASDLITHSIAMEDRPGLAPLRVNIQINYEAKPHQEYVSLYPNIVSKVDEEDLNNLLAAIETIKEKVDLIIVSIHWGLSFQPMVLEYQVDIAHKLIDHGVDVIMGHGPHVLHAMETYKKRCIFYSLGNFMQRSLLKRRTMPTCQPTRRAFLDFGFRWRTNESAIGKVVLSGSEIKRAEAIPIMIDRDGDPQLCDSKSAKPILSYLSVLSRFLGTSLTVEENKVILEI